MEVLAFGSLVIRQEYPLLRNCHKIRPNCYTKRVTITSSSTHDDALARLRAANVTGAADLLPTEALMQLRAAAARLRERIPVRAEGDVRWSHVAEFVSEDIDVIEQALALAPGVLIPPLGAEAIAMLDGQARMRLIEQLGVGTAFTAGYPSTPTKPVRFMHMPGERQVIGSDGNRTNINWLALDTIRDIAPPSGAALAAALGQEPTPADGSIGKLPSPRHASMACYTGSGCVCGCEPAWEDRWHPDMAHDEHREYDVIVVGGEVRYQARTPERVRPAGEWERTTRSAWKAADDATPDATKDGQP